LLPLLLLLLLLLLAPADDEEADDSEVGEEGECLTMRPRERRTLAMS
jgi:hypothetical protein